LAVRTIRIIVRRLPTILLLAGFLALGTGLLESLHLRTHLLEHAKAKLFAAEQNQPEQPEKDCELCFQLHLPTVTSGWVPLLVCLGLLVAFLTLLSSPLAPQRVALRVDCRGPPVL
jgi:hypothetical protein